MKFSIQTKFLAVCILLVAGPTLGTSSAFYVLTQQDKQRESRDRIQVGFDVIFDNLTDLLHSHRNTLTEFLPQENCSKRAIDRYAHQEDRLTAVRFISLKESFWTIEQLNEAAKNLQNQVIAYEDFRSV